jgi:hypothetical protein
VFLDTEATLKVSRNSLTHALMLLAKYLFKRKAEDNVYKTEQQTG